MFLGHKLCMSYQLPNSHLFRCFNMQVKNQSVLKERRFIGKIASISLKNLTNSARMPYLSPKNIMVKNSEIYNFYAHYV